MTDRSIDKTATFWPLFLLVFTVITYTHIPCITYRNTRYRDTIYNHYHSIIHTHMDGRRSRTIYTHRIYSMHEHVHCTLYLHTTFYIPYWSKAVSLNRPPPLFWTNESIQFHPISFRIYLLFILVSLLLLLLSLLLLRTTSYLVSYAVVPRAAKSYILLLTGPFKTSGIHRRIVYYTRILHIYSTIINTYIHIHWFRVLPPYFSSGVQRLCFAFFKCIII